MIGLSKPPQQKVRSPLQIGNTIPHKDIFTPTGENKLVLISFLRHTGCPFAEKTVKELCALSSQFNDLGIYIITHGEEAICEQWLGEIGGIENINRVHDPNREIYGAFGVGYSSLSHFLGGKSLLGVAKLIPHGIRNRKASGTRWQMAATFLVKGGELVWKHEPQSADEVVDIGQIAEIYLHHRSLIGT